VVPGQSGHETHVNVKKLGVWGEGTHSSSQLQQETKVGGSWSMTTGQKAKPHLQNNQRRKSWRHSPRSTASALQAQSPVLRGEEKKKSTFKIKVTDTYKTL
jgi:hypothetical protein